jgi:hypothetical protein
MAIYALSGAYNPGTILHLLYMYIPSYMWCKITENELKKKVTIPLFLIIVKFVSCMYIMYAGRKRWPMLPWGWGWDMMTTTLPLSWVWMATNQ